MAEDPQQMQEIEALGRNFTLGTLYDARKDFLLAGSSLWDSTRIDEVVDRQKSKQRVGDTYNSRGTFDVSVSNSFQEKMHMMNVEGSVKLSVLAGLFELEGSARVFRHQKDSTRSQCVSYVGSLSTYSLELPEELKRNVQYIDRRACERATHIVSAIQYGAKTVFIFETRNNQHEFDSSLEGRLRAKLDLLGLGVNAQVEVQFSEQERNDFQQLNLTFAGDVAPADIPTTFESACLSVRSIIERLNCNGGVPIKVTLMPLSMLDIQGAVLVADINESALNRATTLMSLFDETITLCNQLKLTGCYSRFSNFKNHIDTFVNCVGIFKIRFQRHLKGLIPGIRGGSMDSQVLLNFLDGFDSDTGDVGYPFQLQHFASSLLAKATLIDDFLRGTGITYLQNHDRIMKEGLLSPGLHILYWELTWPSTDRFIARLQHKLNPNSSQILPDGDILNININQLYNCYDLLRGNCFTNLSKNPLRDVSIIECDAPSSNHFESKLLLYSHLGRRQNEEGSRQKFALARIGSITSLQHVSKFHSIDLEWTISHDVIEHILHYEITYSQTIDFQNPTQISVPHQASESKQVYSISGLQPNTMHFIKIQPYYGITFTNINSTTCRYLGLVTQQCIQTLSVPETTYPITIRNGKNFDERTIDVPSDYTVNQLKAYLENEFHVPSSKQRIFSYKGEVSDETADICLNKNMILYRDFGSEWIRSVNIIHDGRTQSYLYLKEYVAKPYSYFQVFVKPDDYGIMNLETLKSVGRSAIRNPRHGYMTLCNADTMERIICEETLLENPLGFEIRPVDDLDEGYYYLYPTIEGSANGVLEWINIKVLLN